MFDNDDINCDELYKLNIKNSKEDLYYQLGTIVGEEIGSIKHFLVFLTTISIINFIAIVGIIIHLLD